MMESVGLQHIFSMSSAVEKVQQVQFLNADLQAMHMNVQMIEDDEQKKAKVLQFDSVDEAIIREKEQENQERNNKGKEEREDVEKQCASIDIDECSELTSLDEMPKGMIINIVV